MCARDAGDIPYVHANGHHAFRVGAELIYGTLERPIIAPGKDDAKPLCEQLTAGLEPQATVCAGDERDAYTSGSHKPILFGDWSERIHELSSRRSDRRTHMSRASLRLSRTGHPEAERRVVQFRTRPTSFSFDEAQDAHALIEGLELKGIVMAGWLLRGDYRVAGHSLFERGWLSLFESRVRRAS